MFDTQLVDRVHLALERNPLLPHRDLRCEAHLGKVVLRGVVGTYYQKQMAQETLRAVEGVDQIANELEVHWR